MNALQQRDVKGLVRLLDTQFGWRVNEAKTQDCCCAPQGKTCAVPFILLTSHIASATHFQHSDVIYLPQVSCCVGYNVILIWLPSVTYLLTRYCLLRVINCPVCPRIRTEFLSFIQIHLTGARERFKHRFVRFSCFALFVVVKFANPDSCHATVC